MLDGLEERVIEKLDSEDVGIFEEIAKDRDLEEVLTRLRLIVQMDLVGEEIDGLTSEKAGELDDEICEAITQSLDISTADMEPVIDFARWVKRSDYTRPIEVVTTNYDLLLESAFEDMSVPYFDGFVGNLKARFKREYVEQSSDSEKSPIPEEFIRLWKIHGSVNWQREDGYIYRLGHAVEGEKAAAIYPSMRKYDQSRKVPFLSLQDRFRRALDLEETVMIISGYSFNDEHINNIIFEAADRNPRSEFIVFSHQEISGILYEHAEDTPNLIAAGPNGAFWKDWGQWKEPERVENRHVWADGEFTLRKFERLAKFLARVDAQEHHQPRRYTITEDVFEEVDE